MAAINRIEHLRVDRKSIKPRQVGEDDRMHGNLVIPVGRVFNCDDVEAITGELVDGYFGCLGDAEKIVNHMRNYPTARISDLARVGSIIRSSPASLARALSPVRVVELIDQALMVMPEIDRLAFGPVALVKGTAVDISTNPLGIWVRLLKQELVVPVQNGKKEERGKEAVQGYMGDVLVGRDGLDYQALWRIAQQPRGKQNKS